MPTPRKQRKPGEEKFILPEEAGRDKSNGQFTKGNLYHLIRTKTKDKAYKTPEEFAEKVYEYFEWSKEHDKGKFTLAGLCLFVHLTKPTLKKYLQTEGYDEVVEKALLVLEDHNEKKLGWAGSTQGAIFWLKNKAGWQDEVIQNQINTITTVEPKVIDVGLPIHKSEKDIDVT